MSVGGARERRTDRPEPADEPDTARRFPTDGHPAPGPQGFGAGGFDLAGWYSAARYRGAPAVYGLGPAPRRKRELEEDDSVQVPGWKLLLRALLNLVVAWEVFVYLDGPLAWVLTQLVPPLQTAVKSGNQAAILLVDVLYYGVVALLTAWFFGRMGRWPLVWRRYGRPLVRRGMRAAERRSAARKAVIPAQAGGPPPVPTAPRQHVHGGALPQVVDPWQAFRVVASPETLALLDRETAAGEVSDVDHQRLNQALERVRHEPDRLAALIDAVRDHGAAACAHPSGARDLPHRSARHDLLLRQVRLGTAEDVPKNPAGYRGVDIAVDPALLGTSLLAVGPSGTGKTSRLARPTAESLCLQALAGTAVVVVVGDADADLGPAAWYDVIVAPGDPRSRYGLDLYGGARRPDEAVARLADALLPDELAQRAESARQALQQVVGPFAAAYGRPPGVRELCLLLRGEPSVWDALRQALRAADSLADHQYELAQRERTHGQVDDPGALLADRLSLLDRAAFAGCFNPSAATGAQAGSNSPPDAMPLFAMHALDHPLRVRIALPEHSHPEAARILARLAVGQFLHAAGSRQDRSLFAGLVVDDASSVVEPGTVRGLQRLRAANGGALLQLRTLVDLPESLRAPLFGAVGGRMAFPGIAPWDGTLFAETWGTVWVDERDVTRTPDTSGGFLKRTWRGIRAVLEGERAQTESVTTRRVERRRWSPSELAQVLPGGHAVLSLTAVDGTPVPPLLVDLRTQ